MVREKARGRGGEKLLTFHLVDCYYVIIICSMPHKWADMSYSCNHDAGHGSSILGYYDNRDDVLFLVLFFFFFTTKNIPKLKVRPRADDEGGVDRVRFAV